MESQNICHEKCLLTDNWKRSSFTYCGLPYMSFTSDEGHISECSCKCMCVCTDLPLSPGTAAIHMILAEQTAIQASTVGSSLMFNRHTWRENNWSHHQQKIQIMFFSPPESMWNNQPYNCACLCNLVYCADFTFTVISHLSHVSITVTHPHLTAAVGTAVAGRRARKLETKNNLSVEITFWACLQVWTQLM